jgi:NAD(P)-dependent dehydrogenase (short-subunit alcohol dehydrogenase family)
VEEDMAAKTPGTSRRSVVGGLSTGFVAALSATASAREAAAADERAASSKGGLVNPVTEYPRPPFPPQRQSWPGLASRMTPRPDHGESSYKGAGRLSGRNALITGGDSGIGRAVAIAFAREGANVAINYLPEEESDAAEVVQLIHAAGRKAAPLPGDIRDEAFCSKLVDDAARALGGLDILVNNAARQQTAASLAELSTEQFDWTFKTNVYAMFWITKAALRHLGPGSAIVNTTSAMVYDPYEATLDYAATKAAILTFTKGLAKQLAPKGIRVNAVAPGPVWTPLQVIGGLPADAITNFGAEMPLGRAAQPVELAPLYVLLASAESSYTAGQVFGAVGGAAAA